MHHLLSQLTETHSLQQVLIQLFNHTDEGVMISDNNGVILSVNPAFSQITGYAYDEAIGQRINMLKSDHHDKTFYTELWRELSGKDHWQGKIWNRRKNGEVYLQKSHISVIRDQSGNISHYISQFHDMTELKRHSDHVHQLAYYDALTGLINRSMIAEKVAAAVNHCKRSASSFALILLDLDRFKLINDTQGHDYGDQILKELSQRLLSCVDHDLDSVARLGGDEFLLLIQSIQNVDAVARFAHQLQQVIAKPYFFENKRFDISASLGIAMFPNDGVDGRVLMKRADMAMYAAKAEGRNKVSFFVSELNEQTQRRMQIELDLRHALRDQQFSLHYQPKIDLETQKISGVEALIRWQHPEKGMISPVEFISIAEETDLIIPIGEWAMEEACRQAAQWQREFGFCLPIAVNVSPVQLNKSNLVKLVNELLQKYALKPTCLQIELTESTVMQNPAEVVAIIKDLQQTGVDIAIDDFGTGYSSLAQLRQFPVNVMKIDRAFVQNMTDDIHDEAIARTIVQLGQSLSMNLVAEGIETEEQAHMLGNMDCHHGQGFWFAKPMSNTDLKTWLIDHHKKTDKNT